MRSFVEDIMADWVIRMGPGHSCTGGPRRVSEEWEKLLLRGVDSEAGPSDAT